MRGLLLDRRAQVVKNIHPRGNNPSLANGWGAQTPNGNLTTFPTTEGPTGGVCMRVELTTAGQLRMQHNTPTAGLRIPVPASTLLTVAAWVYSPRTLTQCSFENQFFNAAGTGLFIRGSEFSLVPGWQFVRSTVVSMAGAVSLGQCQVITQSATGNTGVVGDVYRLAKAMVVIGSYDGVYCDGSTPNWKWLGTPLLSESIGWPYTLESIAKPDYDLSDPSKSVTVDIGSVSALQGRSFYIVPEVVAQVADGNPFLKYGNAVGQDDNAGTFLPRQDNLNTTPNINLRIASGGTVAGPGGLIAAPIIGMHAGSVVIADGFASYRHLTDSVAAPGTTATSAQFQSGGMPMSLITYNNSNGPTSPRRRLVRALFYQREHSTTTQRAIMRWLANRYGVPVSGGA